MKTSKSGVFFSFIFFPFSFVVAQINGSIQSSYQLGNLPGEKPADRSNLYNQVNLQYNRAELLLGLRFESYMVDEPGEYNKLTRRYVNYRSRGLQITVGNFFEILGRGVLLRSYEIPGSVYEDGATRQRYSFYKDIDGLSVRYTNPYVSSKFFYGRPLNNVIPPEYGEETRRSVLVQGGEIDLLPLHIFQPGLLYLKSENNGNKNEFGGANIQGVFDNGLQYYAEYTQNLSSYYDLFQLGKKSPHGLYSSISYGFDFVNASLEYKDYNKYTLSFNDPPPLVREHSYTLLNRSTHTIEPENEKGYQLEMLFNIGDFNTVTVNHSRAVNDFGSGKLNYSEYYGDINYYLNETWIVKFFTDQAEDDLLNNHNRWTFGLASEDELPAGWSYNSEIQYQTFDRKYDGFPELNHSVDNILFLASLNSGPDFTFTLSWEQAKDPLETNTFYSGDQSKRKNWLGFDVSYQYNQNNLLSVFYGERRGGNACTGGVCYKIQSFKGFEFRLNSRF